MTTTKKLFEMVFANGIEPFPIPITLAHDADSIIAPAFGHRYDPDDDNVNMLLAQTTDNVYDLTGRCLSVIAQGEVANHLREQVVQAIRESRRPGKYLHTHEFLVQAWDLGVRRPIIVAHADHAWRVVRTAEKIGFKVVGVADTRNIGYDPLSTQGRTRSRSRFFVYERLIARPVCLWKGYI